MDRRSLLGALVGAPVAVATILAAPEAQASWLTEGVHRAGRQIFGHRRRRRSWRRRYWRRRYRRRY
jgi:hypothetical protein